MAMQEKIPTKDVTTEEKIIQAARVLFTNKGYAATRTRDIAEAAGINLALLNYYYRSKEKLFHIVMSENLAQLFSVIFPIVNNHSLSLEEKISLLIENYIDLLLRYPELPMFVFHEIKSRPEFFKNQLQVKAILQQSSLVKQMRAHNPDIEPVQFIVSLLGMTIFPFVAKQILFQDAEQFRVMMEERKKLVPQWAMAILGN
jgi:AcrR family transcriptional regulator